MDNYSTEPMEMSSKRLPSGHGQVCGESRKVEPASKNKNARTDYYVMDAKRWLEQQKQKMQQAKQLTKDAPAPPSVSANERIVDLEEKVKELEARAAEAEKAAKDEHNGVIEMLEKLSDSERDRYKMEQKLLREREDAARRMAELEDAKNNEIREWVKKYEDSYRTAIPHQAQEQSARNEATYLRGQLEQCQTDFNVLKERVEWAENRADRLKSERDESFRSNARVKAKYEHLGKDFDELRRVNGMLATTRAHKLHEKLQVAKERIKELEKISVNKTYVSSSSNRESRTPETITMRSNSITPFASPTYESNDDDGSRIVTRSAGPSNARPAYSSASVNAYSYYDAFKN